MRVRQRSMVAGARWCDTGANQAGKAGRVILNYDGFVDHDVVARRPEVLSSQEFLAKERDQDFGASTDWYNELIRKGNFGQNHYLAASGGNENSQFRISGNYRTKQGIDIATDRREYGLRANFLQKALDGLLEIGGNFSYRIADEDYTNYAAFKQAVRLNPTIPVMDPITLLCITHWRGMILTTRYRIC
ncbi:hypothetical protein [Niabella hibiscisoli]|uniref:hypothetical protein n=1 Tax=Niabella hibiscisoli TaxID=1825928 RepID=UPI001F0D0C22|nr:hypothetical protein [Niabella hibiscisoli]MCH5720573.1 hypothetical protein [Niabella hibiscisoli]